MRRIFRRLSIFLLGIFLFLPHPVVAQQEKVPTTITSKTMIASNKSRQVVFKGEVHMTQGDLTVRSDEMIIRFKIDKGSQTTQTTTPDQTGSRKIEEIEAKGNVIIDKSDGRATCGHAVYYKDEEKIVLTESPVAWQGGTRVTGPKMTMYLKEGRSIVEGGTHVVIEKEEGI